MTKKEKGHEKFQRTRKKKGQTEKW